jgi:hypothetical protein
VGAASLDRMMASVIGFMSCQDKDLSDACLTYLVTVACSARLCCRTPLGDSCMEIARSGGIRSYASMFFLWPFDFRESTSKLCWLLISWGIFTFPDADTEYHGDACKMHMWSLHFITWYSTLFASYIGYIHFFDDYWE